MAARFTELVIDALDTEAQARWWAEVLGWDRVDEEDGVIELADPSRTGPTLVFVPVPEAKERKNRLHLDLRAVGTDQETELARLLGLGARPTDVGQGSDETWVVLADPEGNELCLLRTPVTE